MSISIDDTITLSKDKWYTLEMYIKTAEATEITVREILEAMSEPFPEETAVVSIVITPAAAQ